MEGVPVRGGRAGIVLRRGLASTGLAIAVVMGSTISAAADGWGSVDCTQTPYAGCSLGAGSDGSHSGKGSGSGGNHTAGHEKNSGGRASGDGHAKPKDPNPDLNLADCSYQRSDFSPPSDALPTAFHGPAGSKGVLPAVYRQASPDQAVPVAGPTPGQPGAWYVYKCSADGVRDAFYRPPIWIPDAPRRPGRAAALPSPAELARVAYAQLRLPSPAVESNPAGEQLVGLPTWLWLDRGSWVPVSARASVPGVSVTAVARPDSVVWTLGDGSTVTCSGPGTRYGRGAEPKSSSPDCGHTYRTSSAGRPGGAFAVSATVHWRVTWAGAGQSGVFPDLTTLSNAAFRVAESQGLNEGG